MDNHPQILRGLQPLKPQHERMTILRNRNIQVIVRLNRSEKQHLQKLVKRSGLTQSTYLRHLINGVVPQDAPSPDYYGMMAELRNIGTLLEALRCDDAVQRLDRAILHISNAVLKDYERDDGSIGTSVNAKRVYDVSQAERPRLQPQPRYDDRALVQAVIKASPFPTIYLM